MITAIAQMKQSLVTHTIRVSIDFSAFMMANAETQSELQPIQLRTLGSDINRRLQKLADSMERLIAIGFTVKWEKGAITAYSRSISATEAKRLLTESGLRDRDFRIYLEYERGWGMM